MRVSLTLVRDAEVGWPDAATLARTGARAEELGFHAIYFGDHFALRPFLNATTSLAVLAAATSTIRLGFAAYVLPFRHPIVAAHELAMLDQLSGGRLVAGLAAGSTEPEFAALGLPFRERGRMFDEGLEAVTQLWSGDPLTFEGEYYRFAAASVNPVPKQEPRPPIWIGSWTGSQRAAMRIARWADGWQASGLHTSLGQLPGGWAAIEQACATIGRDPATIDRAYVNMPTSLAATRAAAWSRMEAAPPDHEDLRLIGTPDDAIERLQRLAATGTNEVSLLLRSWSEDQLELIASEVMSAL